MTRPSLIRQLVIPSIRQFSPVILLLASGFWLLASSSASAQTRPGPGGPGGFDPASIRDRILDRFKTALEPTDADWARIQPKLTKVFLLQLDLTILPNMMGGRMGGMMGPGGLRGMIRSILDPNALPSQVEEKTQDLQTLVDNNETSTSAYTNALAQLHKARERTREQLTAAQKDLTTLLTPRQEATLVQMGLFE